MNPSMPQIGWAPSAGQSTAPGWDPGFADRNAPTLSAAEQRVLTSEQNLMNPVQEDLNTEGLQGSMQQLLADYLGLYVVCEFIIGTQGMLRKEGILFNVGRSFITLYDDVNYDFIVCDVFSLKFVTFYQPGQRPGQTSPHFPTVNVPGVGTVPASPFGLGTGDRRPTVGRAPNWSR